MNSKNHPTGLKWYIHRLSVMDPLEIAHRLGSQFSMKGLEIRYRLNRSLSKKEVSDYRRFDFCTSRAAKLPDFSWSLPADSTEMTDLLEGKGKALGFDWAFHPEGFHWNVAPDTGKIWPRSFFGDIPYRGGNHFGDIRVAWEPSRLQHFIPLALISREGTPDQKEKAVSLLETQFLSWISANPFMEGIHYISVMECGLRLIAVCHAFDLGRHQLRRPEEIWPALVKMVEEHAGLIEKRLSLYSSRGNHTIAEAAALVYAGVLFPEMEHARRWKEKGLSLLESEADHQILPDGGGAEQSFGYLAFILDLYELVIKLMEHNGLTFPSPIQERVRLGRTFLSSVSGGWQKLPSVGDSDHGVALSPFLRLSGEEERESQDLQTFPDAGYSVIRNEGLSSAILLFDHGTLGMPPSYGHGHADALSVIFKLGDREILTDPGTYTYNGDPSFRSYFKSTPAHNTVTVDEEDQAVQKSSFIWSEPFYSGIVSSERTSKGGIRILARHNGYASLKEGVEHFRGISYIPTGFWLIWDYLTGTGTHTLDLHWHLDAPFSQNNGEYHLLNLPLPVSLSIEGGETALFRGETDPILGWKSRMYGTKEPVTTLKTRYRGELPHEFVTRIQFERGEEQAFFESTERFWFKWWTT